MRSRILMPALLALVVIAGTLQAAKPTKGNVELKSVSALAFGPKGVLFIGDPTQAKIFAVQTGDAEGDAEKVKISVENAGKKIAGILGTSTDEILVRDMVANPTSGNVYVAVLRGRGAQSTPVILKVASSGKISEFSLEGVEHEVAELPNPVASRKTRRGDPRQYAITDLQFVGNQLFVAGLSNEEFESNLRSIPYPFQKTNRGSGVKIFHGAHGRFETRSPVRTFTAYEIKGKPHLIAAYQCTPLVKLPIADLKPGGKVTGTTIAELGNRNRPLDMFVYKKDGKDYILLANNNRGVMKITTDQIDRQEGIETKISGTDGLSYETIKSLKGVDQLDRLNKSSAVLFVTDEGSGVSSIVTVDLP